MLMKSRITPLTDPGVEGADAANALSEQTKDTPLNAEGKSVADLLAENGFTNFITQDAAGGAGAAASQQVNSTANDTNTSSQAAADSGGSSNNATAVTGNDGGTAMPATKPTTPEMLLPPIVTAPTTASTLAMQGTTQQTQAPAPRASAPAIQQ